MTAANILIYIHAGLGGIALLGGLVALSVTKGNRVHKIGGKIFFYAMLFSGILALIICLLPGHHSSFLFAIGVFSIYLITGGFRAWKIASKNTSLLLDKSIAIVMLVLGIGMMVLPAILSVNGFNPVLGVFGAIGMVLAIQDLYLFQNRDKLRKGAMNLHIGKMVGGYISAVTAFVVVNQLLPGIWGWLTPTGVGLVYIGWHFRKLRK